MALLKDKLTKPLYQKSFDGDSQHSYIKFEDMAVILFAQEKIAKEFIVEFYKWMQHNYTKIDEYHVTRLSIEKGHPIITIEKALEEYEKS